MIWGNRSLECPQRGQRNRQSARILLGLVSQARGDNATAMEHFSAAGTGADESLLGIIPYDPTGSDLWYDLANMKTLLEEAGWSESDGWGKAGHGVEGR